MRLFRLDGQVAFVTGAGSGIGHRAALDAAIARSEAELGALSVAVNCAGIANAQAAEELELQRWQTMSQASSFCTGVDLLVDGGFVCW